MTVLGLPCHVVFSPVADSGGCSSLQWTLWRLLCCGARALGCSGFSGCGTWVQQLQFPGSRAQAQYLRHTGLVAPQHVESSPIKD